MKETTVPLARYEFRFIITKPFAQSDYAGSMLRGIFGHALKKITCITRLKDCKQCMMYQTCTYPEIFEAPPKAHQLQKFSQIPSPYIIEPPSWGRREYVIGDHFIFSMVLTGQALKQLSLIILVWQKAFELGLTAKKGKGELQKVFLVTPDNKKTLVYEQNNKQIIPHTQVISIHPADTRINSINLEFQTPLRLQRYSKPVKAKDLNARNLLVTLARRVNLINCFHNNNNLIEDFKQLSQKSQAINIRHDLHWQDWTRYSNRQKQKMKLGGLIGKVELSGDLRPFSQLLYLGQWLHMGKNTSFGLGHYQIMV